jgi:succinyl-diaminopimelate desuccinylase
VYDPKLFAEKYRLAEQDALKTKPHGGCHGLELEWNLLDSDFRPLLTVGAGPGRQSFVDYLRAECLSPWLREFSQLEVFHWMIEWATRPYYSPRGAIFEARLMEAALFNALHKAGRQFDQRLYTWPGNLPILTQVDHAAIPGSWSLAKRIYLERCVDLYGDCLATAGTHTNLSLPDALFTWDFMHLPPSERLGGRSLAVHLDEYKSEFYISAARWMRAFASLFIAASAATPFQAQIRDGRSVVILTENDSVRNLTFPNPPALDAPDLYRSYADYLRISYDLVQRGIRFGNNNWTPVRARSFAEPVERLIAVTSDQLGELYARGLYAAGQETRMEDMARQIEMQNLMARINLPMARVEVRIDDGGHPLEVDIANLTLKHLLLARFFADPEFGRGFRYDREDIQRARRNEEAAARRGLGAEIEQPFTAKPVEMRSFLAWTLDEVRPLAEALELWDDLRPLAEMAAGAPNSAERLRRRVAELGGVAAAGPLEAPLEILQEIAREREAQVAADVELIATAALGNEADTARVREFVQRAREAARREPTAPVRFQTRPATGLTAAYPDKTGEIVELARHLIRIPSVTACPDERLDEVHRAADFIADYARQAGLAVRAFNQARYPAVLIDFPGQLAAPVMLSGHFDVVAPEPDDNQFESRIDGDYLWGRGAADMKTVVATYLVWMKDILRSGAPYPPVNLLLVGNEENGEGEPVGTPHALKILMDEDNVRPAILIAGERTGERGDELWGEICTQNRGILRFDVIARGPRGHTGTATRAGVKPAVDLTERLLLARAGITAILGEHLTLSSPDGWQSQVKFPFIQIGAPGVYNVSADYGILGVEVRPIPQDDVSGLRAELEAYCTSFGLEINFPVIENGVICSTENPYLLDLLQAVRQASGSEPRIGRKLPGTSARFAPGGQGVVWGQSGIGPHAADERHYIPSILPYYNALLEYGRILVDKKRIA